MSKKNYLENPFWAPFVVPIAIILVASLIIFGVTKLLTEHKTYRDLVYELETKTFGNRWVAAFELSKEIAQSRIPEEDFPWLIDSLSKFYETSEDGRTRHFIVLALGNLKTPLVLPFLARALKDQDNQVKFSVLVSLGNLDQLVNFTWGEVRELLKNPDAGLRQAAIYTLLKHKQFDGPNELLRLLNDEERSVRYASATALVSFKQSEALPLIREILNLEFIQEHEHFSKQQLIQLKYNILVAAEKICWPLLNDEISTWLNSKKEFDLSLIDKARKIIDHYLQFKDCEN